MNKQQQRNAIHARQRARRLGLQALYQWQLAPQPVQDIVNQYKEDADNWKGCDEEYFRSLVYGVAERLQDLDQALTPHLTHWESMDKVDPIERAVLRQAAYELQYKPEIPFRVVINEAVDLTKKFGAGTTQGFVNAVLDRLAETTRSLEKSLPAR